MTEIKICYLCGKPINENISQDHVPPKQFYPKNLRSNSSLDLLTLPTHFGCNKSYQSDEDYFVDSLGPLATNTKVGKVLWNDIIKRQKRPEAKGLAKTVLGEFIVEPKDSLIVPIMIHLPNGLIRKDADYKRTHRVIWKITKGLFYCENQKVLPENTPKKINIYNRTRDVPEEFEFLKTEATRGKYPEIFDYRYAVLKEVQNFHVWMFLIWHHFFCTIYFHDPECVCEHCKTVC